MSLPIIIILMLVIGFIGGLANFLLPANKDASDKPIRKLRDCVVLGIGATILVPLFLEIAQSKLMDNIHFGWSSQDKKSVSIDKKESSAVVTKTASVITKTDTASAKKIDSQTKAVDTAKPKQASSPSGTNATANSSVNNVGSASEKDNVPGKNYFLFAAYCFVAAAAGFRFINSLIDSVMKDKKIEELKIKNQETEKEKDKAVNEKDKAVNEKDKIAKEKEKVDAHNLIRMEKEESKVFSKVASSALTDTALESIVIKPLVGPVINKNDPQKGRFGGKSVNNNRQLKAEVTKSVFPGFFNVKIWVESTDANNYPLNKDVIFYVHDSFSPSVYSVTPENNKAMDEDILAWGAFTVGAVVDDGHTLLELDLSADDRFPKDFRDR